MITNQRPYIFFIKIALFALLIGALPLPEILLETAPFWMLLFCSYWLIWFDIKVRFFFVLILGILVDISHGDILGQNALALILSSGFIMYVKQSFSVSNLSTQQVYIFVAASIYLALLLLVHGLIQGFTLNYYLLFAPLSSAVFWPVIRLLLSRIQH